ncbi:hypothetical protein ACNUI5_33860 [Pseudomonas aeruginosa]
MNAKGVKPVLSDSQVRRKQSACSSRPPSADLPLQRHAQAFQIHDVHRIRTPFHPEQFDVLEAERNEEVQLVEH